jgi:hypothetical protein
MGMLQEDGYPVQCQNPHLLALDNALPSRDNRPVLGGLYQDDYALEEAAL